MACGEVAKKKRNLVLAVAIPVLDGQKFGAAMSVAAVFLLLGIFIFMAARSRRNFKRLLTFDKYNREFDFCIDGGG